MRKKTKNLLVIIVLLAIIGIGVGYAALSAKLTLNGTATISGSNNWKIIFDDETAVTSEKCAVNSTYQTTIGDQTIEINSDKKSGNFSASLIPGEKAVFDVYIMNDGAIPGAYKASKAVPTSGTQTQATLKDNTKVDAFSCKVVKAGNTFNPLVKGADRDHFLVELKCNENIDTLSNTALECAYTVTFDYEQVITNE